MRSAFGPFAAVALLSAGVIDVIAFGTLPVLRARYEAPHWSGFLAFLAVVAPVKVRKTTLTTQPIMGFRILLPLLPRP